MLTSVARSSEQFVSTDANSNQVGIALKQIVHLEDMCVDFPIYSTSDGSFRKQIMQRISRVQDNSDRIIVRALKNINLKIFQGERVGLLGSNGAGKSTLLKVLSLIYSPTHGRALVAGRISSLLNISLGIDPELSGRENLLIRGTMMQLSKDEIEDVLPEVIAFADLEEFIDLPMRTYSDGMRMRLLFSMATAVSADILLMDEWLSAGDQNFRAKATERMQSLVEKSGVLVLASHSPGLLKKSCTRGIWLDRGSIKMDGPIEDVCAAYQSAK